MVTLSGAFQQYSSSSSTSSHAAFQWQMHAWTFTSCTLKYIYKNNIFAGSHTIGQARCTSFRTRIYNETNIDSSLATSLGNNCPISTGNDDNISPLDASTPALFDNSYYNNLVKNKGLLHSDQELYNGGSTDSHVSSYSSNFVSFFTDFASSMVKMGNISPLTGTSGEIRTNCRKIN